MEIQSVHSEFLPDSLRREVIAMCNRAYGGDLTALFATFGAAIHVLGKIGTVLTTHAMWITRWLQSDDKQLLKTAYVEMVATHPEYRRKGYGSEVMRVLEGTIPKDYSLGALCTGTQVFYEQLGWQRWRGPLSIRRADGGVLVTPDEEIMVRVLPQTPALDFDGGLSVEWREGELW